MAVQISGDTIGHSDDLDLITVASGVATVAGKTATTTLGLGGTTITATGAEINYLDNDDLTAADLQKLADITATAAEINDLTSNDVDASDLTKLAAVTATAAELNYNDVTAAGTAEASKAVILDGSKNIATLGTVGCGAITSTGNSSFVGLASTGDTDLGNATSDTITATGRFDSDLVPSTDSARDLGTSALQWAEVHADAGYIDAMTVTGASALGTVTASTVSGSSNLQMVGTMKSTGAIASSGSITAGTSFIIGSADMNEADLEKLDGITNGTAAASKAVVLDGSKNIATIGTVGCGAITSTGASTMGSLNIGGTLACDTSFTIDAVTLNATELGYIDSATAGTSAASKAMVTDSDGDIFMPDSDKFELGAGSDMQLYHDGTNSYIANKTGALKVATETSGIAVTIGHSTSEVTVSDNLTVGGNLTVQGAITSLDSTTINVTSSFTFEGPADAHETTLHAGTPTADTTLYMPTIAAGSYYLPALADAATAASCAVTAAEFALLDGASSVATVTVADGDGVMFNDAGSMKQVTVQSLAAYFDDEITAMPNLVEVDALNAGSITSGFGNIDNGSSTLDTGVATVASLTCTAAATFGGGLGSSGATITTGGAISADGRIVTDDTTDATSTTDGSLQTDGGLSVVLDCVFGNDVYMASDSAVLNFGADEDVNLTHVADSGLLLNSDMEFMFRDSDLTIGSSADGTLSMDADGALEFTAPLTSVTATTKYTVTAPTASFESSTNEQPVVQIKCTNAGDTGGSLSFVQDSASPAAEDMIGAVTFTADDSGGNAHTYCEWAGNIVSPTNGAEEGSLELYLSQAGSLTKMATWNDGTYGLTLVNSSAHGTVKAHSFVTYSDESLKSNIAPIADPLAMVKKLQGVSYDWKTDGASDIGFIAQQVEKVVPQVVTSKAGEEGSYGMDYAKLTALLTEAIKQQDGEITALKATLSKVLSSQEDLLKKFGI